MGVRRIPLLLSLVGLAFGEASFALPLPDLPPPAPWQKNPLSLWMKAIAAGAGLARWHAAAGRPDRVQEFTRGYQEGKEAISGISATSAAMRSYFSPNELAPHQAIPILGKAISGAYVTVGTERGFAMAAFSPQTTHLVLADIDPLVVLYNMINLALLQASRDRPDYLKLKYDPSAQEWERLSALVPDPQARELMRNPEVQQWWKKWVHYVPFDGPSYLSDDTLFARAQSLAKSDRIQVVQMDMGDRKAVQKLAQALQSEKIPLGVLDISNAYWARYMGSKTVSTIEAMTPAANENSLFVVTHGSKGKGWSYAGFRWSHLEAKGARNFFSTYLTTPLKLSTNAELAKIRNAVADDPAEAIGGLVQRLCGKRR